MRRFSCAVGRNVVINESRFANGSPYWIGDLAQYRSMVVMHQSKGLYPCLLNAWPLASERIAAARLLGVSDLN